MTDSDKKFLDQIVQEMKIALPQEGLDLDEATFRHMMMENEEKWLSFKEIFSYLKEEKS